MIMTEQLRKKVDFAIKLLQGAEKMAAKVGQPVEVCYSGGKDSDVILELAKMAGINYRAIYKNTTIDPPYTIAHCRSKGVEIMRPKMTFAKLIQTAGTPSRYKRFCCGVLKEYKILDYAIVGIRRSESVARAKRYKEPETCRIYSKKEKCRQYLPILEWSNDDVVEFITERGIKCHPLYYNTSTTPPQFDVNQRVGCMCCPMLSFKQRIKAFQKYPNMVKFYVRNKQIFLDNHPNSIQHKLFKDACETFYADVFCKTMADFHRAKQPDLWGNTLDCKTYLEQYFNIKL